MTVQDTAQQTPADRFRVGIDIGGTKIEAVLVDPQDNVRNDVRIPARRGNAQVIDDVVSITHEVAGDLFDQVATVGIGIPGQVNPETGRVDNVVNLDIDTLELGAEAGKRLGIPVHVENDVNAAAVGAARMVGGSHPEGTIVFLNFGTGLAAGIVVDGVVQHGFSGAAGEIGHIPIDPNRFPCPCGQSGCLETVCSGASVGRHWPAEGKPPMPDLIECARRGEPDAQRILVMVTHAIVDAVQIVMLVLANLLLTRLLDLKPLERAALMLITSFTYAQMLGVLMMEQYIVAYFWLALTLALLAANREAISSNIAEGYKPHYISLYGAGSTLLTSLFWTPLHSAHSPFRDFRKWFLDMLKCGLGFIALLFVFGRYDVFATLIDKIESLDKFTGKAVPLSGRIEQYTAFIHDIFLAPAPDSPVQNQPPTFPGCSPPWSSSISSDSSSLPSRS